MADERTTHAGVAFAINAGAALMTVVGGLVIYSSHLLRVANPIALSVMLSVSAGVTMFLSLVVLWGLTLFEYVSAFDGDQSTLSGKAWLAGTICFGGGIIIIFILDFIVKKLTPTGGSTDPVDIGGKRGDRRVSYDEATVEHGDVMLESPHDAGRANGAAMFIKMDEAAKEKLQRLGVLSGIAIAIHNIPEGIATYVAASETPEVGLSMAIGVGLHNFAEGLAVAAPIYFATGSRCKGIMWCVLAALSEHLGGFIAFAILGKEAEDFAQATLYGITSGMMAAITMKEIFPSAHMYANGRGHLVSSGALFGMFIMAVCLIVFKYLGVSG